MAREVWLVAPEAESEPQVEIRESAMRMVNERGLTFVVRKSRLHVVTGGPEAHKRFPLLDPQDTHGLYAAIHRKIIAVIATGACLVRSDPSETPARRRRTRPLEDFVRYKAHYGMARNIGQLRPLLEAFENWPNGVDMSSGDPRILPLHVHDCERSWTNLTDEVGRIEFAATYGTGAGLRDHSGRQWPQATARHGRDELTVASVRLPHGFHWDVIRDRGDERLVTCHEVWRLRQRRSYVNVYPDAFVRATENSDARRVFP